MTGPADDETTLARRMERLAGAVRSPADVAAARRQAEAVPELAAALADLRDQVAALRADVEGLSGGPVADLGERLGQEAAAAAGRHRRARAEVAEARAEAREAAAEARDARAALEARLAVSEDALDSLAGALEAFGRDGAERTGQRLDALAAEVQALRETSAAATGDDGPAARGAARAVEQAARTQQVVADVAGGLAEAFEELFGAVERGSASDREASAALADRVDAAAGRAVAAVDEAAAALAAGLAELRAEQLARAARADDAAATLADAVAAAVVRLERSAQDAAARADRLEEQVGGLVGYLAVRDRALEAERAGRLREVLDDVLHGVDPSTHRAAAERVGERAARRRDAADARRWRASDAGRDEEQQVREALAAAPDVHYGSDMPETSDTPHEGADGRAPRLDSQG